VSKLSRFLGDDVNELHIGVAPSNGRNRALLTRVGERINRQQRAAKPLLLLLDEAANSAPLTDLPRCAATLRSRDLQLVTIFQDYGQVVRRWGRDQAHSVFSNHLARVLLPGLADTELLEDVSKLLGERFAVSPTISHGPGGESMSETQRWERPAPFDELRTLATGEAVLIHYNTPPAKIRLRPYYQQPQWKPLGGWLPTEPTQATSIEGKRLTLPRSLISVRDDGVYLPPSRRQVQRFAVGQLCIRGRGGW